MVNLHRIFIEKKPDFDTEALCVLHDLRKNLGITGLEGLRIVYCFDIESSADIARIISSITDAPSETHTSELRHNPSDYVIGVKLLPGQFDRNADYVRQSIRLLTDGEPVVEFTKYYVLTGNISDEDIQAIKRYMINPVDSTETGTEKPPSICIKQKDAENVQTLHGFISVPENKLENFKKVNNISMNTDDLLVCLDYFKNTEQRDPTVTEMRVLETYWSDHCRHSTFLTRLTDIQFDEGAEAVKSAYDLYIEKRGGVYGASHKPVTLMDIAVMGMKSLKKDGLLDDLDESDEVNACSIKALVDVDGSDEEWLIMFKNETHNHPTEIEPWGGAHTCLGGCIRDPLSGRSYVYQAMRVTGSGDPRVPVHKTIRGKLPQRVITKTAADGYSAYGNMIGAATGQVAEIYHEGYLAKRMECGALIAAVKKADIRREKPVCGDVVILLGARTGRDGIGGASVSSAAPAENPQLSNTDNLMSVPAMPVPKGDPPIERRIVRLFRNPEATLLIKRCNDFGAGGVSVAVGELADGLDINLDMVLTKYDGLDGTELAISESQERMAVVVSESDAAEFITLSHNEGLEAAVIAKITDDRRLTMYWRGSKIVDISRDFLDTNGAKQTASVRVSAPVRRCGVTPQTLSLRENWLNVLSRLNVCSQVNLSSQFDSTVGASTVLLPHGGKYMLTPSETMAAFIPVNGKTETATLMSFGFNPEISSQSPFHGALYAVVESVSKLAAAGCDYTRTRLSFQEYFEKLGGDPVRWGKPFAALLGAFLAQIKLGIPAIGGKDSMSGTYTDGDTEISVPPTLISFAVNYEKSSAVISNELKKPGNPLAVMITPYNDGLPCFDTLKSNFALLNKLIKDGTVISAHTIGNGGICAALSKMAFGNRLGFIINTKRDLFNENYGSFVLELSKTTDELEIIGKTADSGIMEVNGEPIYLEEALDCWNSVLDDVFPSYPPHTTPQPAASDIPVYTNRAALPPITKTAEPAVLIPVFPGTHGEYDMAHRFAEAGAVTNIFTVNTLTADTITDSYKIMANRIKQSQIIALPGGYSMFSEPDGLGKLMVNYLMNPYVREALSAFINGKGLIIGVGTGFQALLRLGLIPFGEFKPQTADSPILAPNLIGRHISGIADIKVTSVLSPWFALREIGKVYSAAVSSSEGRFAVNKQLLDELVNGGQIAAQFADGSGIESVTSPDGLILGTITHPERYKDGLYVNVRKNYGNKIIKAGVGYYK